MSALITAEELKLILAQPHVRVVDASYHQPVYAQGIPGSVDFDIDDIADPKAPFTHTIPTPEIFSAKVGALGIDNSSLVVVYDRQGISMAASRAWWMFRLFGHDNVKILNGGLPTWLRAGGVIDQKKPRPAASFKAVFRPGLVKYIDQVRNNISARQFTLLDARDAGRFSGKTPDPRPHVQSGHIPGSLSTPYMNLINADGSLKPRDELKAAFETAGVTSQVLACSCGSGVTACVVALALYELGHPEVAVYDGSWTEWSADPGLPKAQGG